MVDRQAMCACLREDPPSLPPSSLPEGVSKSFPELFQRERIALPAFPAYALSGSPANPWAGFTGVSHRQHNEGGPSPEGAGEGGVRRCPVPAQSQTSCQPTGRKGRAAGEEAGEACWSLSLSQLSVPLPSPSHAASHRPCCSAHIRT